MDKLKTSTVTLKNCIGEHHASFFRKVMKEALESGHGQADVSRLNHAYGSCCIKVATGRAYCRLCCQKIAKGQMAIKFLYDYNGGGGYTATYSYLHLEECTTVT